VSIIYSRRWNDNSNHIFPKRHNYNSSFRYF